LIKITLTHRDYNKVDKGINWLAKAFQQSFGEYVLGPTAPAVSRIRNRYIKNLVIKVPPNSLWQILKIKLLKLKTLLKPLVILDRFALLLMWMRIKISFIKN